MGSYDVQEYIIKIKGPTAPFNDKPMSCIYDVMHVNVTQEAMDKICILKLFPYPDVLCFPPTALNSF